MSAGGKPRTDSTGEVTAGGDHDPPAKEKLTPFGILMMATGALMLIFGSRETSDARADALRMWWSHASTGLDHVKRKVLEDADNRNALWERLQFSLDGEPDPWFESEKAQVDARQFTKIEQPDAEDAKASQKTQKEPMEGVVHE